MTCIWTEDDGVWDTDCGESFVLNDGGPEDNSMRFCCYCGAPLIAAHSVAWADLADDLDELMPEATPTAPRADPKALQSDQQKGPA